MGMLYHGIGLAIVFKSGKVIDCNFRFDNEELVTLSKKGGLFRDVTTVDDFREYFFAAFNTQYDDCSLEELMEDLSDIDYFEDLMQNLEDCDFQDLKEIVLWTDQECYGYREYCWEKYSLAPYSVTNGTYQTPKIERKGPYEPSATKYIKETILQLNKEKAAGVKAAPQKSSQPTQLTFETFGLDFEYIVREADMTLFGITYPRGVIINAYKGTQKKIVVPTSVEDYPVVHISSMGTNDYVEEVIFDRDKIGLSDDAFKNCSKMATYDENGNKIMFGVLLECKNIQSTIILPGAQKIGYRLFQNNDVIENVIFTEGTENIDNCAFENCKNLRSIRLPNTIKRIGASAFSGCPKLTDVVFPDGIEEIDSTAFKDCKSIRSVAFPKSLNKIGWRAFVDCTALEKVSIHPSTTCENGAFSIRNSKLIGADGLAIVNGVLFDFDYSLHSKYIGSPDGQIDIIIPAEVKKIGGSRCFDAPWDVIDTFTITDLTRDIAAGDFFVAGIKKFRIVNHVTGDLLFETSAFANCPNLVSNSERFETLCDLIEAGDFTGMQKKFGDKKKATSKTSGTPTPQVAKNDLSSSQKKTQKSLDAEATAWIQKYEKYLDRSSSILFPGKLFVFAGFGEEKNHPTVLKVIERGGHLRLKVSGVTDYLVVNPIFAGDSKIKSALEQREKGKGIKIILLEDLEKALNTINTTTAKQSIAKSTAAKSQKVSELESTTTLKKAKKDFTIRGKTLDKYEGKETIVVVPDRVTQIGSFAFSGQKVTDVTLPDSVKKVGIYAFSGCTELKKICIPGSVTSVGEYAFSKCSKLKEITWPGSVKKLPASVCIYCKSLETVVIEEGITEIDQSAFSFCEKLKDIFLPMSLEKIGNFFVLGLLDKPTLHVYTGSYAESYAQKEGFPIVIVLTPEQEAEQKRKQEEEERRKREYEERCRREAEERARKAAEDAERRRKAAEAAEQHRQAVLAEHRKYYDQIMKQIAEQNQIITENRRWFGAQAKARKAARQQLAALQSQLLLEFPNGRP